MEPDAVEIRVLGCLLEKQRVTPYAYPLSLDALRRACNQTTSRNPIVAYEEEEIGEALRRLGAREWVREVVEEHGRVVKYRHALDEALDLDSAELSLLAVLLLRGVQTAGELKERSVRLYGFSSVRAVHESLGRLVDRRIVARHPRRTGQKEERYEQRLDSEQMAGEQRSVADEAEGEHAGEPEAEPAEEQAVPAGGETGGEDGEQAVSGDSSERGASIDARIEWLEAEMVKLRAQVTALLKELGE